MNVLCSRSLAPSTGKNPKVGKDRRSGEINDESHQRVAGANKAPSSAQEYLRRNNVEAEWPRQARRLDHRECRHDGLLSRYSFLDVGLARLEFSGADALAVRSSYGLRLLAVHFQCDPNSPDATHHGRTEYPGTSRGSPCRARS